MRPFMIAALAIAAACAPAAEQAPPGPAPLDSAAARTIAESNLAQYSASVVAGDAEGVASLFSDDATVEYFGFPTTTGRANIQSLYSAAAATARTTSSDVKVGLANGSSAGLITAIGTTRESLDSAGVTLTNYWRWAGVMRQQGDGQWRWSYVIGFPDSTTRSTK